MPRLRDFADSKVTQLSAEHGKLDLVGDARDLRIGDRVHLTVGYADFTTMLHGQFLGVRGERISEVYNIRG